MLSSCAGYGRRARDFSISIRGPATIDGRLAARYGRPLALAPGLHHRRTAPNRAQLSATAFKKRSSRGLAGSQLAASLSERRK
jgi:hypothetical protein